MCHRSVYKCSQCVDQAQSVDQPHSSIQEASTESTQDDDVTGSQEQELPLVEASTESTQDGDVTGSREQESPLVEASKKIL